jgi:phosphoadenosine phosphosulfate reductase
LIKPDERENLLKLHIDEKIGKSKSIIREAVERFGIDRIALAITGGKDSTTNLWLSKQVCDEMGIKLPVCMFIDEGNSHW